MSITDSDGVIRYCTATSCPGVAAARRRLLSSFDTAVDICVFSPSPLPTTSQDMSPIAMVASFVVYINVQVVRSLIDDPQGLKQAVIGSGGGSGNLVVVVVVVVVVVCIVGLITLGIFTSGPLLHRRGVNSRYQAESALAGVRIVGADIVVVGAMDDPKKCT